MKKIVANLKRVFSIEATTAKRIVFAGIVGFSIWPSPSVGFLLAQTENSSSCLQAGRPILTFGFDPSDQAAVISNIGGENSQVQEPLFEARGAAWAPIGRRIALVSTDYRSLGIMRYGNLPSWLMSLDNGNRFLPRLSWSPKADRIAVVVADASERRWRPSAIYIVDTLGMVTQRHRLPTGSAQGFRLAHPESVSWSPDGSELLVLWEGAWVIGVQTGNTRQIAESPVVAEWLPSGGIAYFEKYGMNIPSTRQLGPLFQVEARRRQGRLIASREELIAAGIRKFSWLKFATMQLSPSGAFLAIASGTGGGSPAIRVYDLSDKEPIDVHRPSMIVPVPHVVAELQWNPSENCIAAALVRNDGQVVFGTVSRQSGRWNGILGVGSRFEGARIELLGHYNLISW